MTRARDTLILTGNVSEKKFNKSWPEMTEINATSLLAARNSLDWVAAWFAKTAGTPPSPPAGGNAFLRWTVYDDLDKRLLDTTARMADAEAEGGVVTPETGSWQKLYERLAWQYPQAAATHEPAKTSVSLLRRRLLDETEARPLFKFQIDSLKPRV